VTIGASERFTRSFTALPEHIDQMGHVNNTVWLQWVQDIATAHWQAIAPPAHQAAYGWVVTRHEIDYRGNITAGEVVEAETWIPGPAKGARFDRCVAFRDHTGRVIVEARTSWAMIDLASRRLMRVPDEVSERFLKV
jgi:acyl-CoA thioester hydrolase